jgi:hypothetical protein
VSGDKGSGGVQSIYSALIGGLMASFVAVAVFTWLVDPNGQTPFGTAQITAVLIGLASAAAFMIAGMLFTSRLPWLSGGFLFASGFTIFWSSILSLSAEPRWVVVVAMGVAVVLAIALGWWRFGRQGEYPDASADDAG